MSSSETPYVAPSTDVGSPINGSSARAPLRPWLLPAIVLIAAYWGLSIAMNLMEAPISTKFFTMAGSALLLPLLFTIWWFSNRRVAWRDRFLLYGTLVGLGILAGVLVHPSIGGFGLFLVGTAIVLTVWTLWMVVTARASRKVQFWGAIAVFCIFWGAFLIARMDGIKGNQMATLHWRWTPTAESQYLAEKAKGMPSPKAGPGAPPVFAEGDWAEFRGPHRQGELHGVQIATDWSIYPPKQLWRQRVGPAWSSFVVIGDRLYTQEQRAETEATICLDASTGKELWMHGDKARFWDGQAGAGPRSTPTFVDARLYTLGGTGILNCLDAQTGAVHWMHDIAKDTEAPQQMWGFSGSPLVTAGLVVVWAGSPNGKGLLAYRIDDGTLAWTAPAGMNSYSSPQLITVDGQDQIAFLSEEGVIGVDPPSGKTLWEYKAPTQVWRVVQPRQIGPKRVMIGTEDLGLVQFDVEHAGDKWSVREHLASKGMRPAYNDLVISDGFIYGIDGGFCCCANLETGKRKWKGGRYGHGQLLLLADQKLLLVLSEAGDVALVKASPERHEEIAKFSAITGKTWNHPVIAHGRLFTRNDEEMACFELKLEPAASATAGK